MNRKKCFRRPRLNLGPRIVIFNLIIAIVSTACSGDNQMQPAPKESNMVINTSLPTPITDGETSLEQTLLKRRSVREFKNQPLSISEISQLLWAAQGITSPRGYRTAPSAGALYPIELYVVSEAAVSHYDPRGHSLTVIQEGDLRAELCAVALKQEAICEAPVTFVLTVIYDRVEVKYGATRSPRYVHLEAGHAAQNLLLQAVALNLGATPIGAFHDNQVQAVLGLPDQHEPLYLIPVGHPK